MCSTARCAVSLLPCLFPFLTLQGFQELVPYTLYKMFDERELEVCLGDLDLSSVNCLVLSDLKSIGL